uniref:SDR family NAD(P)-dependent oxidoreductase n=1 Tax=Thaumasiovibrio occultus TaxID=1891184 RepID=UPI000B362334|nr:SDR family oxidoreductase [Thaumasiovibrio occultus]
MKTVLVTGASKGIGAAIAAQFARNHYHVLVNARKPSAELDDLLTLLTQEGCGVSPLLFDVTDPSSVSAALSGLKQLDVIVNNAGILRDNLLPQIPREDWQAVMNTNIYGPQSLVAKCESLLAQSAQPCVVNMASISGVRPRAGQGAYAVAKAMLIEWTRQLAQSQLKAYAVSPGPVATDMIKSAPWYKEKGAFDRIPMRRFAEPEEVAALVFQLADSQLLRSGENVVIDGGFTQTTRGS